ncbi:nucleoside hydrolase [Actinocrispum wychmicini]|uniref:Purine nucleosidase/ribosylpyrimidine nucleosidase n=1 Tax=Actinocrispum wychmicini TaxID=1213861 RepID=A0A4R2J7X5_9PSEU|nr:nucleoside hydrolase [Actinocrispum wychmicini]TCO53762.1 purine nucleosidase/ribosylpyrimidine nucleosidase [Actinocrispum wychmicini]
MPRKLILDVDTGTDDAVAIMFAALHPDLDLVGVTTVNGNVPLAATTDNTLRVLDHIGRADIPVYPGLAGPIARHGFPGRLHFAQGTKNDMHGGALPLPAATSSAQPTGAVEFLVETLRSTSDPVTLVAVGPLSNVATALAIDPSIVDAVAQVVIMGGAHAYGNVTASAEFNIWVDPEAANMVFAAGFERLTLVPLDATHQALITRADCAAFAALGTPAGTAAATLITRRIDAYSANHGAKVDQTAPVHDAVCTAYLVRPDVVSTRRVHVTVETIGVHTIGRTVMDLRPNAEAPNADVAFTADKDLFTQLLTAVLAGQSA